MKKLYKLILLPYQEKKLIIQSMFWVTTFRLCLWCMPYKMLKKIIPFESLSEEKSTTPDFIEVKNVVNAVRRCSYYIPHASCLTQALATRTILRLKGQNSQLRIGVGRDAEDQFIAHAWVESNGEIIIGGSSDMYRYSIMSDVNKQGL